jgi:hypothetical protein
MGAMAPLKIVEALLNGPLPFYFGASSAVFLAVKASWAKHSSYALEVILRFSRPSYLVI